MPAALTPLLSTMRHLPSTIHAAGSTAAGLRHNQDPLTAQHPATAPLSLTLV